jgi:hypothetical protein
VSDAELQLDNDTWRPKHGIGKKISRKRRMTVSPDSNEVITTLRHLYKIKDSRQLSRELEFTSIRIILREQKAWSMSKKRLRHLWNKMLTTLPASEKPLNSPDESSSESAPEEDVHPNPSAHATNSKSDSKRDAATQKRRCAQPHPQPHPPTSRSWPSCGSIR